MGVIRNPILRGFNPDPSIVRVGDDYFIATSTFEFHPAVRIHHSTDLVHWTVRGHALDEGFDLRGVPDSGGVWAPSLSHSDGLFWLAYSVVRSMDGDDKDIDNYLVTAESIEGPWSEPVHLGSRGFDFSFFHDPDGTHWIVGVQWDQRPEHPSFAGLVLEQYLPDEKRTSGTATLIHQESTLVEGPNLYRIGDWYHLLIAAGGTGWNHAITVARSRKITGPYERDSQPFVLTTRDAPGLPLQKAGHGELVQTPGGEWMLVHLASRPTLHLGQRYSTLGRETCLQRVVFDDDGWLRLSQGGHHAAVEVEVEVAAHGAAGPASRGFVESFDATALDSSRWSTLRAPLPPEVADLTARPGWLRLRGGHSPASVFDQSMIVTRVEEHRATFEATVDAEPTSTRELAGVIAWYDRSGWIWLQLCGDAENGRHLRIVSRDGARTTRSAPIPAPEGPVRLRADLDGPDLRFAVAAVGDDHWTDVPGVHPAWTLSDDHGDRLRFTGLFFGIRADDLDGRGWSADVADVSLRVGAADRAEDDAHSAGRTDLRHPEPLTVAKFLLLHALAPSLDGAVTEERSMKIERRSIRKTVGALTAGVIALSGALLVAPPAAASPTASASAAPAPLVAAQGPAPEIVETVSDAGFAHPGIGFRADNLENMRSQVLAGVDPWASYYDAMVDTRYAAIDYRVENAQPGTDLPKNDAYASVGMRSMAQRDGIGVMTQALEYLVTGDEQYRANALHGLRAWSSLDPAKYEYFADAHIHTGVPLYYMLIAAELIRSTEPANASLDGYDLRWTDADEQRIEDNLVRPVLDTFLSSNNRLWNQHLYGVIGMISAAIFLDDADLYAERVEWFTVNAGYESEHDLYGGNVNGSLEQLFREIPADAAGNTTGAPFVQHMEMLRDQAHGQGDVDLFVALARIVDAQGTTLDPTSGTVSDAADAVSPYDFLDHRILDGADTFYAFMMGEEVPYVPATEGGAISQAYRGRLQDPLSEAYLQYRYVADVDVAAEAPHVAELYEQRDGPLYYYGTGVQNFWNDRGSDYTGAEYWVAFPEELAEVDDSVAPLAPSAELSVRTFGTPLGAGAARGEDADTSFIRLDAAADDADLAIRRAIWGDRAAAQSLVAVKVRSDGTALLQASRTAEEPPFAEIIVPDTDGEWRYVWLDLALTKTPAAVGENILFLRATGSDATVDVAGLLAQANGVITPPVFADAPELDAVLVAGEQWTRGVQTTDAAGETVTLALQDAPSGMVLQGSELSWSPVQPGATQMTVAASDGTTMTALPVTITVVESRDAAIAELVGRAGESGEYTSASWARFVEARTDAEQGVPDADAAAFAALLEELGDAVAGLVVLTPVLADGTLDYRSLVSAAPLTAAQLTAITDGDNQTTWGDQRVPSIVFDVGSAFRVGVERFGFQARDTFANRAEGTNVYGSNDGATWTLLTEHPNAGQNSSMEWIDVREEAQGQPFRFLKFQVDEPGVPSDPAYPGIWSIAEIRIDGSRTEAVGSMDTVSLSSADAVAGRIVTGDAVEVRVTGPSDNTDVRVAVLGSPATVTSAAAGEWVATAVVPDSAERGARVDFTVDFTTADGRDADTIHATTDGSRLFLSSDDGRIDSAFRDATVLRPDGVVDTAWTQYTARMLDGDPATHSDTRLNAGVYGNVWDFGPDTTVSLSGAEMLVRQDGYGTSRIADMRLEGSNDLQTWTRLTPAAPAKTLDWQQWAVEDDASFRYIRLVNGQILNVAELIVFGEVSTAPAVPAWDAGTVFDTADVVSHDGAVYTAQWWTKNEEPGSTATGSWMQQGAPVPAAGDAVRAWTASYVYVGGEIVAHEGHTFRATWWTRNQEPGGANGPWEDLGAY